MEKDQENNLPMASVLSPEEQERLRIQEEEAIAAKKLKFDGYLKHLDLDTAAEDTQFMDVNYDNGERGHGRTVIALGQFALHGRMTGEHNGPVHNQALNIDVEQEVNFDVSVTVLREQVNCILIQRKEIDWSIVADAPPEDKRDQYSYTLDIFHGSGNIQLQGLSREVAITYKKVIYGWRTFHNAQFMNMIRIIPQQP